MTRFDSLFLLVLWVLPHLILLSIIWSSKTKVTIWSSIILLSAAYLLKPATSDLPRYSVYFSTGYLAVQPYIKHKDGSVTLDPIDITGEPYSQAFGSSMGFAVLSKALGTLLPDGPLIPRIATVKLSEKRYISDFPVLTIAFVALLVLIYSSKVLFRCPSGCPNNLIGPNQLYAVIILGSLFFLLGSQNTIRQFVGTVVVVLSIALLVQKKYLLCMFTTFLAASIHHWVVAFICILLVVWVLLEFLNRRTLSSSNRLGGWHTIVVGLCLGCIALAVIKAIFMSNDWLILEYITHNRTYIAEIKQYGLMDYSLLDSRSGPLMKLLVVGSIVLVSELIMGEQKRNTRFDIRGIRLALFSFMIPLIAYPEILSRYLSFYFVIEMLYLCWAYLSFNKRMQIAAGLVFALYGFAPNGINILMGPEWSRFWLG